MHRQSTSPSERYFYARQEASVKMEALVQTGGISPPGRPLYKQEAQAQPGGLSTNRRPDQARLVGPLHR